MILTGGCQTQLNADEARELVKQMNKPGFSLKKLSPLLLMLALTGLAACQVHTDQAKEQAGQNLQGKELSGSDLALLDLSALPHLPEDGFKKLDQETNQLVTAVFGGPSTKNLGSFLTERVKYFISAETFPSYRVEPKDFEFAFEAYSNVSKMAGLYALNLGMGMFLESLREGKTPHLVAGEHRYPIQSPRAGFIVIGKSYKHWDVSEDGEVIEIPSGVRLAQLFHESRHSDCSVAPQILAMVKKKEISLPRSCGQLHSMCQSGPLVGEMNCDDFAWGAFSIVAVYLKGILKSETLSTRDRILYKAALSEVLGRMEFDYADMLKGKGPRPVLSSIDIRGN